MTGSLGPSLTPDISLIGYYIVVTVLVGDILAFSFHRAHRTLVALPEKQHIDIFRSG